jgi:lipoyl(octanoyl) transferase
MKAFSQPEWRVSAAPVPYPDALTEMETRVDSILAGQASELVWLLEHPPLYTAGTSAKKADLTDPSRFPVFETGRGGQYTYHGPGQRVIYAMMDLRERDRDLRAHVWRLEEWIIRVLADFGIKGERREGRVGVWVETAAVAVAGTAERSRQKKEERKIAALGVRCRRWVTSHGLSLNVNPDLSHYAGIVPCGLGGFGVTSLHELGVSVSMEEVDGSFQRRFRDVFYPTA